MLDAAAYMQPVDFIDRPKRSTLCVARQVSRSCTTSKPYIEALLPTKWFLFLNPAKQWRCRDCTAAAPSSGPGVLGG